MNQDDKARFLAEKLSQSKRLLDKVESKDFVPSIDPSSIKTVDEGKLLSTIPSDVQPRMARPTRQLSEVEREIRLNQSKMPSAILESLRNQPIGDPTSLDATAVLTETASELMKKNTPVQNIPFTQPMTQNNNAPIAINMDTKLLEYIIQKTVEETISKLFEQTNVNENFSIRVGNKTFLGKLTKEVKNGK